MNGLTVCVPNIYTALDALRDCPIMVNGSVTINATSPPTVATWRKAIHDSITCEDTTEPMIGAVDEMDVQWRGLSLHFALSRTHATIHCKGATA